MTDHFYAPKGQITAECTILLTSLNIYVIFLLSLKTAWPHECRVKAFNFCLYRSKCGLLNWQHGHKCKLLLYLVMNTKNNSLFV